MDTINQLNKKNRDRMNGELQKDITFDWENQGLLDLLAGHLPQIRPWSVDSKILRSIQKLETTYNSFNYFFSNHELFLKTIRAILEEIASVDKNWRGLIYSEIEIAIQMQKSCLISGEGGIGKSFFIKQLEERLSEESIPHLCLYGKYQNNFENIPLAEITETARESGFVFVFDAINELDEEYQEELLDLVTSLSRNKKIRIILTYRTGSINDELLDGFKHLSNYEYFFSGVSFESALHALARTGIPDVLKYEDILYSNNPLFLSILYYVLSDEKITNTEENSIASITYILERYIKLLLKNHLGRKDFKERDAFWTTIKDVAKWMYKNKTKQIDLESLNMLNSFGDDFIPISLQMKLIGHYESTEKTSFTLL